MTARVDERPARARRTRDVSRWVRIGAVGVIIAAAMSAAGGAAFAATPDGTGDADGSLTVQVDDGLPDPTPSPTSTGGAPPTTSPFPPASIPRPAGSTPSTTVTQATIPDPVAADDALGTDTVTSDGVIAMSGLTTSASPSLLVANGTFSVDFVVRNLSATAFDATARFWVDTAYGSRIADIDDVQVDALQPDETRRVKVVFEGLGQNLFLSVHATLTPPATVEGNELAPLTREATAFVPPWFSIAVVGAAGLVTWLGWWLLRNRGFAPRLLTPARSAA